MISEFGHFSEPFSRLLPSADVWKLLSPLSVSCNSVDGWNDCSVELRELASCVSAMFLGFLWINSISLSFKARPSRPWKFRVCCFLLYQLMITLPFEHLNCFVFPSGVSHFPCNFKTFSTNFFRDSKSFIHTNFPSLRWRHSSSQDSGIERGELGF